jgi:hypothetical protein
LKYKDEAEVLKALKISDWNSVDKDSMLKFGAMLPEMDSLLAQKLIEQFPNFKELALGVLASAEASHKATLDSNDKSQNHVYEAWSDTRQILKGELKDKDLTWEQRKYIIDLLIDIAEKTSAKDSEAKEFLKTALVTTGKITLALVAGALIFVGAKALDGKDLR